MKQNHHQARHKYSEVHHKRKKNNLKYKNSRFQNNYKLNKKKRVFVDKLPWIMLPNWFHPLLGSNIIFMTKMSDIVTKSRVTVITRRFGNITKN